MIGLFSMMMAFSLVACGSKTSTTDTSNEPGEETWAEITQDQVKADFAAKEDAPWNHVEVTDTLIHQELQKIMLISSSLVEGEWKLETLKVDGENVDDVGGLAPRWRRLLFCLKKASILCRLKWRGKNPIKEITHVFLYSKVTTIQPILN